MSPTRTGITGTRGAKKLSSSIGDSDSSVSNSASNDAQYLP